ncbi:DUF4437 domain-containing protein [Yinghuangia seranimata]|uniref:DUF4437 domain-containing protein n=1 Tax=Yinghuangia seranimata TaxID=408067 RepID=UPI00248AF6F0|nr:DUF4437 domain-containing protein [Yinghuangia seranimata]MDI2132431.1 DUF4437 domain-containing protein [Yinghuangia seranimata]
MRPHVETIQENDYVWHAAELVAGEGRASERRLSVDEEDGSSSLRIDFHTDWGRGPGIHHADTEYYVVEGEMRYGDRVIGKGSYVHAPKGVPVEAVRFAEGTRILHYREYGDAGFDPVDSVAAPPRADARGEVTVHDSAGMDWIAVPNAGPMPGLFVKYLHVDPVSGFYTRLVHSAEGWADHRLAHHPCYEEAYTLEGKMSYNFGDLDPGTYFFRPARVKHGHFVAMEGGTTWLMRSDGELENWYTQNEWVRWGGDAVNYGPEGGRMTWSYSSHDLAGGQSWRSDEDLRVLGTALNFQKEHGAPDTDYVQHGTGPDRSLVAMAQAFDLARLAQGHGDGDHTHDHDHDGHGGHGHDHGTHSHVTLGWPAPESLEHPDERHDGQRHNWGVGRAWKRGVDQPLPPIISTLPVRSRSLGRWDGDGM